MSVSVHFLLVWSLLISHSVSLSMYKSHRQRSSTRRSTLISKLSASIRKRNDVSVSTLEGPPGIDLLKKCYKTPISAGRVDITVETHNFVNETHKAMEVQWVGNNRKGILALATSSYAVFTIAGIRRVASPSRLWKSNDGRTFKDISHAIKQEVILDDRGMLRSPLDPAYVILIVFNRSRIYISKDGGDHFGKVDLSFTVYNIKFHPKDKQYLLALSRQGALYYSQNFGFKWKLLMTGGIVDNYEWVDPHTLPYSAYATVVKRGADVSGSLADLHRFDSLDQSRVDAKVAFAGIHQFVAEGKFIILSSAENRQREPEIRGLNVSEDGGNHWNKVQLPEANKTEFYHFLDASEGLIFLHVAVGTDPGRGAIYASDGSGVHFVRVLDNHLFVSGMTDFYKVRSIRGTYITSIVINDNILQSMITYDRGGRWQPLKAPESECASSSKGLCFLHLHHVFSKSKGVNISQGIVSHENAPGLVMAHGNTGKGLKYDNIGVYVSSDGGYNWNRVFDGSYYYVIADSGGLLLAVPLTGGGWAETKIYYSFDWGLCWHWTTFISERFHFTGLLIEPTLTSTDAAVWGYTEDDRMWHVNTLDFRSILRRPCTHSDYKSFVPHLAGNSGGCLFGYKETFYRRTADSLCYGGKENQPRATNTSCACTKYDFECDYGYHYDHHGNCIKEPNFRVSASMYCHPGQATYHKTLGYRHVPGDNCRGGVIDQFVSQETEECNGANGHKIESHGGKDKSPSVPNEAGGNSKIEKKKKGGGVNVAATVLIPLALVVVVIGAFFVYKKCWNRDSSKFDYKYSMLAQENEYSRKDLLSTEDDGDDDDL
ncbi:sortilin-like [Corticium candelabrum]|uniref:sortilin-like n=1 Tax=Corticium candelabrum TaxID=121492 RepID=UPI002E2573EA|nr:sortilin-like [Corticium candelabrum]